MAEVMFVYVYLFIYYFSSIDRYKMIMDLSTGYNNSNITLKCKGYNFAY